MKLLRHHDGGGIVGYWINGESTQCGRDVDVDVKVEAGVFEQTEATLPLLGPVTEFHQVADAVGSRHLSRWQLNVLRAQFQPHVLLFFFNTKVITTTQHGDSTTTIASH